MEADLARLRGRQYRRGGDAFEVGFTRQDDLAGHNRNSFEASRPTPGRGAERNSAANPMLLSIIAIIIGTVIVLALLSVVFSSSGSGSEQTSGKYQMESDEFDEFIDDFDIDLPFDGWSFSFR